MTVPDCRFEVPWLTTGQMREVDRAMVEDYRIELIQMMENAGRNLARLAGVLFLGGDPVGKNVVVLAGSGGNGGGAMVSARRLIGWGARVRVLLTKGAEKYGTVPSRQRKILDRMGAPVDHVEDLAGVSSPDLIIDGIIGYSLKGAPRGRAADMIRWANRSGVPVLALDTPSGVDASSGRVFDPAIRAAATLTLALPKEGLRAERAREHVGDLYLADIGVPPELYAGPS
ncbi:MAG: NAD(P)H-hydrate epimerase, partial [Deltaproteobacteria bacterium]|nr:NAD(P)H-hydrate epimerase [Deltaproteobacteria bacterium]